MRERLRECVRARTCAYVRACNTLRFNKVHGVVGG